jgi:hypothetical protein
MRAVSALRRRVADEGGFTMIIVIGVLIVLSGLSFGAYAAVSGDIHPSAHTDEGKRGYEAAEAGLGWYQSQMALNPSFAANCTGLVAKGASGPWQQVDASDPTNKAQFLIEALPVNGTATCTAGDESSMVDPVTRTMRVRVTGRARPDNGTDKAPRRSIIATFRRTSFPDFAYFSDLETVDPLLQELEWSQHGTTTTPDYGAWAAAHCGAGQYWAERQAYVYKGTYNYGSASGSMQDPCYEGEFNGAGDSISGPFHSNDSIMLCGGPTFGSGATDTVEVSNATTDAVRDASTDGRVPGNPWACATGMTDPRTAGTPQLQTGAPMLQMPAFPSSATWPAGSFISAAGKTTIALNGANYTINGGASTPLPANAVFYVTGTACYAPETPSTQSSAPGCGDVKISGTYSQSVTVFAQGDIIITGNLTRTAGTDAVLGLVADNWVRVHHPTTTDPTAPAFSATTGRCTTNSTVVANPLTIQAAILALKHSFIVDNWTCPNSPAGQASLTVTGSVAGKYHPVTAPPWGGTGYADTYTYDPRLSYHQPPRFPQPAGGSWGLARTTEQSPSPVP